MSSWEEFYRLGAEKFLTGATDDKHLSPREIEILKSWEKWRKSPQIDGLRAIFPHFPLRALLSCRAFSPRRQNT